jgi:hypothetical protein
MVAILIIISLILPRLLIAALWLLSGWFDKVFTTWYWPLLGFLCMPHSMLWYSVVKNWFGGEWGFPQIFVLILAVMMDLGIGIFNRNKH